MDSPQCDAALTPAESDSRPRRGRTAEHDEALYGARPAASGHARGRAASRHGDTAGPKQPPPDEMDDVLAVAAALGAAHTEDEVIRTAAEHLRRICDAQFASVGLLRDGRISIDSLSRSGEWARAAYVPPPDGSIISRVLVTATPYRADELSADPHTDRGSDSRRGFETQLSVPLKPPEGAVLGVLTLYNKIGTGAAVMPFTNRDERIVTAIATQATVALERARATGDLAETVARLRSRESWFSDFIENAVEGIFQTRFDGRFLAVNPALAQILGYQSPEDLLARAPVIRDVFINPARQDDFIRSMAAHGRVTDFAFRARRADGTPIWLSVNARGERDAAGRIVQVDGFVTDITARREAGEAIRFQAQLLDAVRESVIATDTQGRVTYWNRGAEALYGWTAYESRGRYLHEMGLMTATGPEAQAVIAQLQRGGAWSGELTLQRRDGRTFPALVNNSPILDEHGALTGIIGVSQDITERRQAEMALVASEARLRSIVHNVSDVITIYDARGVIRYMSPAAERVLGYGPAEILAGTLAPHIHPDDIARLQQELRAALHTPGVYGSFSARLRHRDGTWRQMEAVANNPPADQGLGGLIVTWRDVTEARRLAARLAQAERLSAIGELAAGVAHEVNNPLAAISLSAELALREPVSDQLREDLTTIHHEAQRAGDIVRALLRFARHREPALEPVQIEAALDEALALSADRLARFRIEVVRCFEPVPPVWADRDQFVQVFLHLINNAVDAIRPRGRGRLTAGVRPRDTGVEAWLTDDGPGIPAEVMDRLFDPFFTTKEVGEGTGLGLSISHSIVSQHGGTLTAENARHGGACFRLTLPSAASAPSEVSVDPGAPAIDLPAVHIVHPDALVARALAEAARLLGYNALIVAPEDFFNDGADRPPHVIVAADLAGQVSTRTDQAPYTRVVVVGQAAGQGCDAVLPLPYRLHDLELALKGAAQ